MTRKELSQLYYLNREIEQDKQRLAELEAAATSTGARITGLPHASGVSDKTSLAVEIGYLRDIIGNKMERAMYEYKRLISYIDNIDDSLTRQIFMYRFVNGYNWVQVAMHIGGGNTPKCLSNICYRYISKRNNQS